MTRNGQVGVALILLGAALVGCWMPAASLREHECDEWLRSFFRTAENEEVAVSTEDQLAAFSAYLVSDQYSIYICGNQYIHPPTVYLASAFAREGSAAVPFLSSKLKDAQNDATVRDIVLVFKEMERQGTYDVEGDEELMQLMIERAKGIKSDAWQEIVLEAIGRIKLPESVPE